MNEINYMRIEKKGKGYPTIDFYCDIIKFNPGNRNVSS